MEYIEEIEKQLKIQSTKNFLPMQLGDVPETSADISLLKKDFNYAPKTSIEEGIEKNSYFGIKVITKLMNNIVYNLKGIFYDLRKKDYITSS